MTVPARQRLTTASRAALPVLAAYGAALAGLLLGGLLLRAMGADDAAARLPWYTSRAAGITAYLLLTATTVLGLAISTRLFDRWLARPAVYTLHEHFAWVGVAATLLHIGALLFDTYLPFSLAGLLLPFAAPYRPAAVALGVFALYLHLLITGSFSVRGRIGRRAWRALHMTSFALFIMATAHGLLAGSSSGLPWMQWLYLASGGAVLFLINARLLLSPRGAGKAGAQRRAEQPAGRKAA